jgi:hypothetical protein
VFRAGPLSAWRGAVVAEDYDSPDQAYRWTMASKYNSWTGPRLRFYDSHDQVYSWVFGPGTKYEEGDWCHNGIPVESAAYSPERLRLWKWMYEDLEYRLDEDLLMDVGL